MSEAVGAIARKVAPQGLRSAIRREIARQSLKRFLHAEFGDRHRVTPDAPFPPSEQIIRTNAKDEQGFARRGPGTAFGRNVYVSSGLNAAHVFLLRASEAGVLLKNAKCVFDFGCGEGRVLRHLRGLSGLRLIASDTRAEAIAWCRENLPGPDYHVNGFDPPLAFIDTNAVDIVYAYSVFTHIPVDRQTAWLAEMRRILRPGGVLLATVMSECLKSSLSDERRKDLERSGALVIGSEDAEAHLATRMQGSLWDVYQSRKNLEQVFSESFNVHGYFREGLREGVWEPGIAPLGQDLIVAAKPVDGA
ncbi:MAG: class I SAM-dependent methyltransferase [Pseudomonadota bacterium]